MTSGEEKPDHAFAHLKITKYISAQLKAIKKEKTQREIAAEIGYNKPNMISMLKRGEVRVPLEKIPALAKALHVDAAHLYRLAVEDYWPAQQEALRQIFGTIVSKNEAEVLEEWRRATGNRDIAITPEVRRKLRAALATLKL